MKDDELHMSDDGFQDYTPCSSLGTYNFPRACISIRLIITTSSLQWHLRLISYKNTSCRHLHISCRVWRNCHLSYKHNKTHSTSTQYNQDDVIINLHWTLRAVSQRYDDTRIREMPESNNLARRKLDTKSFEITNALKRTLKWTLYRSLHKKTIKKTLIFVKIDDLALTDFLKKYCMCSTMHLNKDTNQFWHIHRKMDDNSIDKISSSQNQITFDLTQQLDWTSSRSRTFSLIVNSHKCVSPSRQCASRQLQRSDHFHIDVKWQWLVPELNEKMCQDNSVSVSVYDKFYDRKKNFPPIGRRKKLYGTLRVSLSYVLRKVGQYYGSDDENRCREWTLEVEILQCISRSFLQERLRQKLLFILTYVRQ